MPRLVQMLIEAEIFACVEFGGKHYLSGVHGKMLHNMIDRLQHADVEVLHGDAFGQPRGRQRAHHSHSLVNFATHVSGQFWDRHSTTRGKLRIARPLVWDAADLGGDPLPHIAAKVQHQIADGVLIFIAAHPHLVFVEFVQTDFDSACELVEFIG